MEPDIKPERVEYDTTLDEIVDTQLRATRLTKAGRSWRRRTVAAAGVSAGGVAFLALSIRADAARLTGFVIAGAGGFIIGTGWGWTYGRIYDWWVRRQARRFIAEWLGGKVRSDVRSSCGPAAPGSGWPALTPRTHGAMQHTWKIKATRSKCGFEPVSSLCGIVFSQHRPLANDSYRKLVDLRRDNGNMRTMQ